MADSEVLTIRIPSKVKKRLNSLAKATGRSKSFLAAEALRSYVEIEAWQVNEIRKAVTEADRGNFASEAEVEKVFSKWNKRK